MLTKGEYRVGKTFNPSNDDMVAALKSVAADFIDLVEGIDVAHGGNAIDPEVVRLKALAQTEIESAAMWAVKAATKQVAEVRAAEPVSAGTMAVADDPFVEGVRTALGKYRSISAFPLGDPGATGFVRRELAKIGFLAVSSDDVDEAIVQISAGRA